MVRQGSWICSDLIPRFSELVCLVGIFYILGCSASYPPPSLGDLPGCRSGRGAELCPPVRELRWTRRAFLPRPAGQAAACGLRVATWLRFRVERSSSAGELEVPRSQEYSKQRSCGHSRGHISPLPISPGPLSQPGCPACLVILGASPYCLIKFHFSFSAVCNQQP